VKTKRSPHSKTPRTKKRRHSPRFRFGDRVGGRVRVRVKVRVRVRVRVRVKVRVRVRGHFWGG
jgi:hypothetical protein